MKNILFMGSLPFSLPLLNYMADNGGDLYRLAGVVTQPDRPQGRGQQVKPNAIATWAEGRGIPCLKPEKPGEEVKAFMINEQIDLVLVMAYGHMIKEDLLSIPPLGMLNFHVSILPKYRGATPMPAAIACGDSHTGVTLMQMVRGMDAGDVVDIARVEIAPDETTASLSKKLGDITPNLLDHNIKAILDGSAVYTPQEHAEASFCRKVVKNDAWINFSLPAEESERLGRALSLWSAPYFTYNNTPIRVGRMTVSSEATSKPAATVIRVGETLDVATTDGVLQFHELQRPGGRMLPVESFINGFPIAVGSVLMSNPSYKPLVKK